MKSKIDYKEITKLIDLLEKRNLTHFDLEIEDFKISIGRSQPQIPEERQTLSPQPTPLEEAVVSPETEIPVPEEKKDRHYITSPMVGTFYHAPDPSSPPFVEIGEKVKKNQTLCIIEAMKLMNTIESDTEGIVEDILIENGKPVEYGQRLFAIKLK